jgi:hypothetical protein
MGMEWMIVGACVVAAWTLLSILGAERQCKLTQLEIEARTAAAESSAKQAKPR